MKRKGHRRRFSEGLCNRGSVHSCIILYYCLSLFIGLHRLMSIEVLKCSLLIWFREIV